MKNLSSITSLLLIGFIIARDYNEVFGDSICFLFMWIFVAIVNDLVQGFRKPVMHITTTATVERSKSND